MTQGRISAAPEKNSTISGGHPGASLEKLKTETPPPPHQSDHGGKKRSLQLGNSGWPILVHNSFWVPPPPLKRRPGAPAQPHRRWWLDAPSLGYFVCGLISLLRVLSGLFVNAVVFALWRTQHPVRWRVLWLNLSICVGMATSGVWPSLVEITRCLKAVVAMFWCLVSLSQTLCWPYARTTVDPLRACLVVSAVPLLLLSYSSWRTVAGGAKGGADVPPLLDFNFDAFLDCSTSSAGSGAAPKSPVCLPDWGRRACVVGRGGARVPFEGSAPQVGCVGGGVTRKVLTRNLHWSVPHCSCNRLPGADGNFT